MHALWLGHGVGIGAALALTSPAARAAEAGTGIVNGVCGVGQGAAVVEAVRWCGGLRADLLFGREAPGEGALGAAAWVGTSAFRELTLGLGPSALLPFSRGWVGELTAGPLLRRREGTTEGGVGAWGFVGQRPHNYHGQYSMAWGLTVGWERSFGPLDASTLVLGVRLDGVIVAVPAIFAWEGLRRHDD